MDLSWLHFSARFPLRLPSAVKEPTEIRRDKSPCDFGSTPSGLIADVGTDSVVSLPGLPILERTGFALSLQISNSIISHTGPSFSGIEARITISTEEEKKKKEKETNCSFKF